MKNNITLHAVHNYAATIRIRLQYIFPPCHASTNVSKHYFTLQHGMLKNLEVVFFTLYFNKTRNLHAHMILQIQQLLVLTKDSIINTSPLWFFDVFCIAKTKDLLYTRPVIPRNAFADSSSYSQFYFLLIKGNIYRTRRLNLYYRIQLGKASLEREKNMKGIPGKLRQERGWLRS